MLVSFITVNSLKIAKKKKLIGKILDPLNTNVCTSKKSSAVYAILQKINKPKSGAHVKYKT